MEPRFQFFAELRRRSVFKVAAAYVVSGWLFLQVASIVFPAFAFPEWVMRVTLIALVAGFPVACIIAWAYELTATGLRRDEGPESIALPASEAKSGAGASSGSAPPSWEMLLAVVVLAVVVAGGVLTLYTLRPSPSPHLAVLPFRVLSTDPGADIVAAGLMETLTSTVTQLGQFEKSLWVVPASEIPAAMTPSAARDRFGVSLIVSGSLQFDGDTVRLTLNLIDAKTERQLRSHQIDVAERGVMGLQDEATRQLARMLNVRLSAEQTSKLARGASSDPDAGRLYLEGRGLLRNATSLPALDTAIARFEQALAIDPSFALAAAGLGEAYWKKYRQTEDVQWVETALQHSRHSLALDSTLAPTWITLGILRRDQGHDEAAADAFKRALAIDPGSAGAYRHLASVYRNQGDLDRAESTYRRAIARQPEYWRWYNALGAFYYGQGRYEEAVAQYTQGLRLAPTNPSLLNNVAVAYWQMRRLDDAMGMFERILAVDSTRITTQSNLATAYFYLGRYDEAARLFESAWTQQPKDHWLAGSLADAQSWGSTPGRAPASYQRAVALVMEQLSVRGQNPFLLASLAQYYARLQRLDSARVWLRAVEDVVDPASADVVTAFSLGALYESLGDRDRGLSWMRRALDRGYGWIRLAYSPWLADLRTDARVRALLQTQNLDALPNRPSPNDPDSVPPRTDSHVAPPYLPAPMLTSLPPGLRSAALLLAIAVAGLAFAPSSAAQNRSDRYLIHVSPDDSTCRYQIQGQPTQDVFLIRPGGLLTVQARGGLWVDLSVEDDPRGVPGTRNQRSLALRGNAPRDTLTVRSAIGRSTEHRVRIQCCLQRGRRANECPQWTDALPPETTTGDAAPRRMPPQPSSRTMRGPAAMPDPAALSLPSLPTPLPPGGPVMRVEEDG